jgi:hypothetical protein
VVEDVGTVLENNEVEKGLNGGVVIDNDRSPWPHPSTLDCAEIDRDRWWQ